MFTGIIEEIGTLYRKDRQGAGCRVGIQSPLSLDDVKIGDSIAVNGACLTVTEMSGNIFFADVSAETMAKTIFSSLKIRDKVNLEKAMQAGERFGGHIVTGHIDGVGKVTNFDIKSGDLSILLPEELAKQIVVKGSVSINGVSLTISKIQGTTFSVALIPLTIEKTTIEGLKKGDIVNIECDTLGKYVNKVLEPEGKSQKDNGVTKEFLLKNGYIR